ncbi:M23 family metallopeptidase [Mucilaginibacter sp. 14171R-50]|uniref:M23 family metallopeptidase n=1 Tax=Mucilaginibacter sp. 14171R-50 TaxID=2703789 RepID=UPI00138B658C|nr:M23 family metallopeptidase [Mucilaginibacter sp. 14171R-50]QHS55541.1 M23 family metallopeptidase [Mucilaginibacter sp. 14171R-50]
MKKLLLLFIVLVLTFPVFAQDARSVCLKVNELNNRVLNSTVKRLDAAKQFKTLIDQLDKIIPKPVAFGPWAFPLKGYNSNAIGGTNGNGYSDKGYNYLDGNKHTAHPAHDIFIRDKNQDGIDDKTGTPVNVLAIEDGVVIACSSQWEPASTMRGGKFIWVYHPEGFISYYAHNQVIFVQPGDGVKQGQKIAEVGRTGLNAYKKRSPTHLHFSAFHIKDGLPVPFNPYRQLVKSTAQ